MKFFKNNWRKKALIIASVYYFYLGRDCSKKDAFIKALEFYYKPPREGDITHLIKEIDRKNYVRYAAVLTVKGLQDVLDEYFYAESFNERRDIDILSFQKDYEEISSLQIVDPRFQFNCDDYGVIELIYSFLVIEHPRVIIYIQKEKAANMISHFLSISKNAIQVTSRDSNLIRDIKLVEDK